MKTFHILKLFIKLAFITMFAFCSLQKGFSQKNTIKFTPLKTIFGKTNISFERKLTERYSILTDVQFWYISNKERKKPDLGFVGNPIFESNNGMRYSLALRKYSKVKERGKLQTIYYFGGGGFLGYHNIFMERERKTSLLSGALGRIERTVYPEMLGGVDLISGGVYLDLGFQIILLKRMKFEFGLIAGNAWTNQEDDFVTLLDQEPYTLEVDRKRLEEEYSNGVLGLYLQPMFNIGFSF